MKTSRARRALTIIAASTAVACIVGCASTRIESQWVSPDSSGLKLTGKLLVVGLTRDETMRRLYEDAMAQQLARHGLTVVRSYELLGEALTPAGAASLRAAAQREGAATILSSALVSHQHVADVVVEPLPEWGWGYPGWYRSQWELAARTEVRMHDRYVIGTSLTDTASGRLLWAARAVTQDPVTVEREINALARRVDQALVSAGFF